MTNQAQNLSDIEDARWSKWSKLIGSKPTFLFKAALDFIEKTEQQKQFEKYLKGLVRSNNKD